MKTRRWRLLVFLLVGVIAGAAIGITLGLNKGSSPKQPSQALQSPLQGDVPRWIVKEHLPQAAKAGAQLFATGGCTNCHTYAGAGASNLGAPDLTAIGSHHLGIGFQIRHLRCPSCVNPGSPMPPFRALGSIRLRELAVFLEDSKGIR